MKKLAIIFVFFALTQNVFAGEIFYAETNAALSTNSAAPVDFPGLTVTIPAWSYRPKNALVTVNIPSPFAIGYDFPGGVFLVAVNGVIQNNAAAGVFTYSQRNPESYSRIPVTLVTKVALPAENQAATIQVKWYGIRNSTVKVDSQTSLSVQLF